MSEREAPPPLPTNAEDLKRHKALSSMESASTVSVSSTDEAPSTSSSDPSALGAALGSITSKPAPVTTSKPTVAVRVKAEDVAFIMEHLDLPKPKATDLLRRNGGELITTLRAFITAM
ncbi:hypothetical protein L211DRAFT_851322 [Terfezia boudieri ATCC MYA-4762]|uniref:Nascent polypeptide-associated complex subunit alpha-like UBA domain-containing protein n=1 Tax=Terfezia boudieri ATCC MYA-4762 TaxID=1051890 RepID=A0A3N4LUB7_9PEZI|nr:hypothetical protein L211DRAFT_851322 [Terfezia boudieri ATCC MYA-4762]